MKKMKEVGLNNYCCARIHETYKRMYCFHCSMLKQWIKRKKRGTTKEESKPRWEADYELVENEGLFQEYLEMSEFQGYRDRQKIILKIGRQTDRRTDTQTVR